MTVQAAPPGLRGTRTFLARTPHYLLFAERHTGEPVVVERWWSPGSTRVERQPGIEFSYAIYRATDSRLVFRLAGEREARMMLYELSEKASRS